MRTFATPWQFATLLLALAAVAGVRPARAQTTGNGTAPTITVIDANRIDGHAAAGTSGAVGVNSAAGDNNAQANLRAISVGDQASAVIHAHVLQANNRATPPDAAVSSIGGNAFNGASGLVSINQASGNGNAELNAVASTLARQGIREVTSDQTLAGTSAWAGGQTPSSSSDGTRKTYAVAVEPTAMQGTHGVVQLNQIAGSGNVAANIFTLGVNAPSR